MGQCMKKEQVKSGDELRLSATARNCLNFLDSDEFKLLWYSKLGSSLDSNELERFNARLHVVQFLKILMGG